MAKGKSGKTSAVSKKATGKHKRSTGKHSSVRATPKPSGHELLNVVCSECFGEFAFDTGVRSDTLECPICGHVSNRPDDGTLHKVSSLSKAEKTNFMITFILAVVSVGGFAAWAVIQRNPLNSDDNGLYWGPLGTAGLAALILMFLIPKYEKNRWETYF
ncbi:MAG: hypothetical protein AB7N76_28255 [Planctomycetota bacterium]